MTRAEQLANAVLDGSASAEDVKELARLTLLAGERIKLLQDMFRANDYTHPRPLLDLVAKAFNEPLAGLYNDESPCELCPHAAIRTWQFAQGLVSQWVAMTASPAPRGKFTLHENPAGAFTTSGPVHATTVVKRKDGGMTSFTSKEDGGSCNG